jgi:hypothetical protein
MIHIVRDETAAAGETLEWAHLIGSTVRSTVAARS